MRLNLDNVTLCSIDSLQPRLALRAVQKSLALCDFAEAILFSHAFPQASETVRFITIEQLESRDDYSKFVLKELCNYIRTPFVLIVQWDGYVLDPLAWRSAFTGYDFIGAKWGWHNDGRTVGNGGFSLRSCKLLHAVSDSRFPFLVDVPEDVQICRIYRDRLVRELDIRFAPESVADAFSYERSLPNEPTFGFHGLFNMWRYSDDDELIAMVEGLAPQVFHTREYYELLIQYYLLRKFEPLRSLYARLKNFRQPPEITSQVFQLTNDMRFAKFLVDLCEKRDEEAGPAVGAKPWIR